MSAAVSYETRLTLFEKVRTLTIDDSLLRIEEEGVTTEIPLNNVIDVRCRYQPTRVQLNRYECLVTAKGGTKLKIGNQFYQGVADFEERSEDYRKFVVALHVALATLNPDCIFHSGVSPTSYYLNGAFLISMILVLAFLLIVLGFSLPTFGVIKLVLLILLIPYSIKWFFKNKPKNYRPKAIPIDILPEK